MVVDICPNLEIFNLQNKQNNLYDVLDNSNYNIIIASSNTPCVEG